LINNNNNNINSNNNNNNINNKGSSQHLKTKYGSGYQIEVATTTSTTSDESESVDALRSFLRGLAPTTSTGIGSSAAGDVRGGSSGSGEGNGAVKFLEWHAGSVKCELPSRGVTLASVFQQIESSRARLGITGTVHRQSGS
jgi:hypothetical protein